jgi:hypothetical protein
MPSLLSNYPVMTRKAIFSLHFAIQYFITSTTILLNHTRLPI